MCYSLNKRFNEVLFFDEGRFNRMSEWHMVGTLGGLLEKKKPDDFVMIVADSFVISGYVYELRSLLSRFRDCSLYAMLDNRAIYRI